MLVALHGYQHGVGHPVESRHVLDRPPTVEHEVGQPKLIREAPACLELGSVPHDMNPDIGTIADLVRGSDDGFDTLCFSHVAGEYEVVPPAAQWRVETGRLLITPDEHILGVLGNVSH